MQQDRLARYGYIDSLRGFAILAVVMLHVGNATNSLPYPISAVVLQGQRGVQLFFLVSALTLVLSARSRLGREARPTLNFFIRRIFRIAPMFWVAIGLYLIVDGWGPRWGSPAGITPNTVLVTATFLHGWAPENVNGIVPGGWTIAAEMTFYLLLPALLRVVTSLTRAMALVAVATLGAVVLGSIATSILRPLYPPSWQYLVSWFVRYWFPAQLPIFAIGICLSFIIGREVQDARSRSALAIGTAGFLFFAMSFGGYDLLSPDVLYGAALALFVWGLALVPWKVFVNRVTRYLGMVSYSVYLLHFVIVDASAAFLIHVGLTGIPLYCSALAMTLAGSIVCASVTFFLVERPGIAVGGMLIRRLERSRPVAAAAFDGVAQS